MIWNILSGVGIGFVLGVLAARRYLPELNDARLVVRWALDQNLHQARRHAADFEARYGLPSWDELCRRRVR